MQVTIQNNGKGPYKIIKIKKKKCNGIIQIKENLQL